MTIKDFAKAEGLPANELVKLHHKGRIKSPDLFVKKTKTRGRGVFAARDFEPNECIEICPLLPLSKDDYEWLDGTGLSNYWYGFRGDQGVAIALGYGGLYNHSYQPSAWYKCHTDMRLVSFWAIRKIRKGYEVTINYNGTPSDQTEIWFKVDEETARQRRPDIRIHLSEGGGWSGWAWCGEPLHEGSKSTAYARRVTCPECRRWMKRVKRQLTGWVDR